MSATSQRNGRATRNPLAPPLLNPVPAAEPEAPVSPFPPTLAAALSAFQGAVPPFPKTKTARVQTRTGGEYTYKYADLGDILPIVGPLLAEFGLAWSSKPRVRPVYAKCEPCRGKGMLPDASGVCLPCDGTGRIELPGGTMVLDYTLLHVSGEVDTGEIPLGVPFDCKPQELGSALTYIRRYAISAQLNLATEADDDGQQAQDAEPAAKSGGKTTVQPTATRDPDAGGRPVDTDEKQALWDLAKAADLTAPQFANVLKIATGNKECQWKSPETANRFINMALPQLRAAKIDAVKAGIAAAAAEGPKS